MKDSHSLEVLRAETLGTAEEFVSYLNTIETQAKSVAQLFEKLSPFSGRGRSRAKRTTVEQIIDDAVRLLSGRLAEASIQVALPAGETRITVRDEDMAGIFVNLIDNAIYWLSTVKHSDRRIAFSIETNNDTIAIIVSDNGPGIEERDREKIFQPYVSRKPDGVGLGLTIAGELAVEYGGSLELVSDGPLDGATFLVRLQSL